MNALSDLLVSWKIVLANPLLAVLSSLLDALFLFAYGFLTQPVRDKLFFSAISLAEAVGQALQQSNARIGTPSMMELVMAPAARPHVLGIVVWLLVLLAVAFVLYAIFQGLVWRLAAEGAGVHKGWKEYLRQFALLNAVWFVVIGAFYFILTLIDMRAAAIEAMTREPVSAAPRYALLALVAVTVYLMLVSYGELRMHPWSAALKRGLRKGIAGFLSFAPAIIVLLIVFVVLNVVISAAANLNESLGFIVGIALVLPALFFARIYINRVVSGS